MNDANADNPASEAERRHEGTPMSADAPAWITPALIELTIRIWQPFYGKAQLSAADAVQIIIRTGGLFSVLGGR